jgi:DNA-binding response OmpR family regulator
MTGPNRHCKVRVLVVDDDPRILNFIRPTLRVAGYDAITATDGEEALRLVDEEKPSIIVLDIVMSPIDGFEVLTRLRAYSGVPVLAMSAHASTADRALSLGANDFLCKPFRPDELVNRIKTLLEHGRSHSKP